jgi:thiosulfate reductase cytochrome b subunit
MVEMIGYLGFGLMLSAAAAAAIALFEGFASENWHSDLAALPESQRPARAGQILRHFRHGGAPGEVVQQALALLARGRRQWHAAATWLLFLAILGMAVAIAAAGAWILQNPPSV